jgi:N-acetylglutamate synthase-like GNAT family acetyltransferase/uncharacterized damage-inducible protein DinB
MNIVHYTPAYQVHFERLNRTWIEEYFQIEPKDEWILQHPKEAIINKGGEIFFATYQGQIIGTVALIPVDKGIYEMAKMAVDNNFQGLGAGKLLCKSVKNAANTRNADKLILFTNSKLKKAIQLYHQFGFKVVPLHGQEFARANIKMELALKPKPLINWFERKFDFNLSKADFEILLDRLDKNAERLRKITVGTPEQILNFKPSGKWSIKEHIGHLSILESIWQKRFLEIKEQKPEMSSADLNNTATNESLLNQYTLETLIVEFQCKRQKTIQLLKNFKATDFKNSLLHPRLKQPMRIIDLMYFVAEHDDHHIYHLSNILNGSSNQS